VFPLIFLALASLPKAAEFAPLDVTWSQPLSSALVAPPVADDRAAYLALRAGRILAVSLADGRTLWEIDAPVRHGLAVGAGMIFAAATGELIGIDAAHGGIAWRIDAPGIVAAPAWRAGWVLAGLENGDVLAVRAADGHVLWRVSLGAALGQTLAIDGDRAFAPLADGAVVALDLQTGSTLWRRQLPGTPSSVTVASDRLYVGCTDNFFYSLDAGDGDRRWRWRTGADVIGGAAVDAERVYFVSLDNVLRALDAGSGVLRWSYPMDTRPLAGPMLDRGLVVVSGMGRAIRVVRPGNGTLAGTWTAPRELAQPPLMLQPSGAQSVRAVIVTGSDVGEWRLYGLGEAIEPAPVRLKEPPGRPLSPDGPPSLRAARPPAA
jgi:outer membrane protein assembly factor BamB